MERNNPIVYVSEMKTNWLQVLRCMWVCGCFVWGVPGGGRKWSVDFEIWDIEVPVGGRWWGG